MNMKNVIKSIPEPVYHPLRSFIIRIIRIKEKWISKKHFVYVKVQVKKRIKANHGSDNERNVYNVIYRWNPHCGIFSHIAACFQSLYEADCGRMIPVFDTRDVPHLYKPDKENDWWELYFLPPGGYTVDEIGRKIVISDAEKTNGSLLLDQDFTFMKDEHLLTKCRWLFKKYIKLNKSTENHINNVWGELTNNSDGTGFLGVRCRGSGYCVCAPDGASKPMDGDEIVHLVKTVMEEYGFDKVFIATDDNDVINLFENSLFRDDQLYYIREDDRITQGDCENYIREMGEWDAQIGAFYEKTTDKYLHTLNYLTEIYLLTKCEGIISNKCSAAMCLPLIKDDWKYEFYY